MSSPLNKNYIRLKVILLAIVYMAACTTHLFLVQKTVVSKKHNYNSIFKRKTENIVNLERAEKTTVNEQTKSSQGIIKNIDLFFTRLLFEPGKLNLKVELSPHYHQLLPNHYKAFLDCSIIRA